MSMPTLREHREQAGLSLSELARRANVDFQTARKADLQQPVRRIKAIALVRAISQATGQPLTVEEVDGLITN